MLKYFINACRSQWPRGLRRRSAAARLLRSWVRIPPAAWLFVCCECCVLSGRGLSDELITRPEESYWCVVVCDLETSRKRSWTALGRSATGKKIVLHVSVPLHHHQGVLTLCLLKLKIIQMIKITKEIHIGALTRCHSVSKFYFIFIWSSTCFGRHTAHHQEPKTALTAYDFA